MFKPYSMRLRWVVFLALILVSSPVSAQLWGVRAVSSLGDIRNSGGQSNFTFDFEGGPGTFLAEVMIDDATTTDSQGRGPWDRGTTHGFGGLNFSANHPPSLKAEAILTGNKSTVFEFGSFPAGAVGLAGVFASDIFQYTGTTATTLSLTFTLEGVVSDPAGDAIANPLTYLDANVAVFADTPDYQFIEDVPSLVEVGATLKEHSGVGAFDLSTLFIDDDTGGAVEMRQTTLMFDVVPGETFYVHQNLGANAAFGARLADAFSTLSAEFDQPQFVMSLSGIPEPNTLILTLTLTTLGLLALCCKRRERP